MTTTASDTGLAQALATLANWPDPDAWSLVLERVGEAMENLARRLSGDGELARDAVQEALLQIRDNANSFRAPELHPDRAARSWILRVTAHTALTLRRKQLRRQRHEVIAQRNREASNMNAEHGLTTDETAELMRTHLAELPEPTRAAIILHHCEGMGFADVASALGVPEGTAKIRVHRGLALLRERLTRVGFAGSVLLVTSALEKFPAGESAAVPFTTTAMAHGMLSKKISSSVPFITKGITMTMLATTSSAAALLLIGSVGLLLSQDPALPKPKVTVVPPAPVHENVPQSSNQAEIQPQPLMTGNPDALAALKKLATLEDEHQTWAQRLSYTKNRGFDLVVDLSKVGEKKCSLISQVDWRNTLDALAKDSNQIWRMRGNKAEFIPVTLAERLRAQLVGRDAPSGTRSQVLAWFTKHTNFQLTLHATLGSDNGAILHWAQRSATTEEWINGLAFALKATALLKPNGDVVLYRRPETAPLEAVITPPPQTLVYQDPPTACLDQEITLDFQDTDMTDVAKFLSKTINYPVEIDPKTTGGLPTVGLKVEGMKFKNVLGYIAELTNTSYKVFPDRVLFTAEPVPENPNDQPPMPQTAQ
jgi:RNA polymerase sigma factor (sigma-70 family)